MEAMHFGLSRVLKRYGHNFDITKKASFSFMKSIDALEDAQRECKVQGRGHIRSYKEIPLECYIVGLGLNCKFIDLLFKRSVIKFIEISFHLDFIVSEIIYNQTDTLTQRLIDLR